MKTILKFSILLLALATMNACSSDDEFTEESIKELKLSIPTEEYITTDAVDFEFEILGGNSEYAATLSNEGEYPNAKVTIDGTKVVVNLLDHLDAKVIITDKKGQKATVFVRSLHKSLQTIPSYGIFLDDGQVGTMDIEFGAGAPYTIEKIRGTASSATIADNAVKVTSSGLGDTYYLVRDKRGTITRFTSHTTLQFDMDMTSNYLIFDGVNNLSANVRLQWGTEWEVIGSTENVTESVKVSRVLISTGVWSDFYVLFIKTLDKGVGTDTITLKNKDGDLAVVKINVK